MSLAGNHPAGSMGINKSDRLVPAGPVLSVDLDFEPIVSIQDSRSIVAMMYSGQLIVCNSYLIAV